MKLYTEEQVLQIIDKYNKTYFKTSKQKLDEMKITPIELPSDEDIDDEATHYIESGSSNSFRSGAKWLRDKIQGGIK